MRCAMCLTKWAALVCRADPDNATHGLYAETGRWAGADRTDSLCQVWHSNQDVEDGTHFLFDCPAYSDIRSKYAAVF